MLGIIRSLWVPKPPEAVNSTYIALVAAARNPFFYTHLHVPDTLDGRFDLIVLHLFMLQHNLQQRGDAACLQFSQQLGEAFIRDLDANLREMGVADTGVGKRMKLMGKSYHGRLQAYSLALSDDEQLKSALARNLYGTMPEGDVSALTRMAHYVRSTLDALHAVDASVIFSGALTWPQPQIS